MATNKKPRKRYDAQAYLKNPLGLCEHIANAVWLTELNNEIKANALCFNDFDKLLTLHRATFYDKYTRTDVDVSGIRGIIERIFLKSILPQAHLHDGVYFSVLKTPLKIHVVQREYLSAFIDHHIQVLFSITDRREYAQMVYHGLRDHQIYCKLILDRCPLDTFLDKKADRVVVEEFEASAVKFNVKELRSFV